MIEQAMCIVTNTRAIVGPSPFGAWPYRYSQERQRAYIILEGPGGVAQYYIDGCISLSHAGNINLLPGGD